MRRTVVLLAAGRPDLLPVAALPALLAAEQVFADAGVPDAVAAAAGALPLAGPFAAGLLLTLDPARAAGADEVIRAPRPAGTALLEAVAVMDRLRSPGGCPWDAEQTHESLLRYLVEECYELHEAVEDGERAAIREELGDVLLQVLFHARIAGEHPATPFGIDEVAADLVAKLVGRHPHVFTGSERVQTAQRQEHRWEELKRAEKRRTSSLDGVATGQPAAALAAKLTARAARAGLPAELITGAAAAGCAGPAGEPPTGSAGAGAAAGAGQRGGPAGGAAGVGAQLFALAARATMAGIDPEAALRTAARGFAEDVRAAERAAVADGRDPHALDAGDWRGYWPRRH